MITIEKIDLGDFVRLVIWSRIEITYNWPVAVMEFNFPIRVQLVSRTCAAAERGIVKVGVPCGGMIIFIDWVTLK